MSVLVCTESFDPSKAFLDFEKSVLGDGAVLTFLGVVRPMAGDTEITAMEIDHYPGLTERSIGTICDEAKKRWSISAVKVIHRVGLLEAGDPIVFVGVSSSHRRPAYEAIDFIMDFLKTDALFWKKEVYANGARWIEARGADHQDAARWDKFRKEE